MTRPTRTRNAARAALLAAVFSGAIIAATGSIAVNAAPAYGIEAPAGITVDVGSCSSHILCASNPAGLTQKLAPVDLTALPDWKSAVNGDYNEFVSLGIQGISVVVRNDSQAPITVKDMNSSGTMLNHKTNETAPVASMESWGDTVLEPGEFMVVRPMTTAFGDISFADIPNYDVPTDYTLKFATSAGEVVADWSGTPTGSWNSKIFDPVITADEGACEAGSSTGKLSFGVSFTPSELAMTWADTIRKFIASPDYDPTDYVMFGAGAGLMSTIHLIPETVDFVPTAAAWKTSEASDELRAHLESVSRSHSWMATDAPIQFLGGGIDFKVSDIKNTEPWPADALIEGRYWFKDVPISWSKGGDTPAFTLGGESLNGFSGASFASTEAAVVANPCFVPKPTPTPTPSSTATPTPTPSMTPTATPTPTPSATPTPTPTAEPTQSPSPTPTSTSEPTATPVSPSPSETPEVTAHPSPSNSAQAVPNGSGGGDQKLARTDQPNPWNAAGIGAIAMLAGAIPAAMLMKRRKQRADR